MSDEDASCPVCRKWWEDCGCRIDFPIRSRAVAIIDPKRLKDLEAKLEKAREALEKVRDMTGELQPNSGHMYLSTVNDCFEIAREALREIE